MPKIEEIMLNDKVVHVFSPKEARCFQGIFANSFVPLVTMHRTFILLCCFCFFLGSCKDDDAQPYSPFANAIIGDWTVQAFIDNDDQSQEAYPNSIDPMIITFTANHTIEAVGPCNLGISGNYLVTENGGLQITDFEFKNSLCNVIEIYWEGASENSLNNAYHVSISGSQLTILSNGVNSMVLSR